MTTYREFVLVGFNAEGEAASLESFSLAATEAEFWALAAHPGSDAARQAASASPSSCGACCCARRRSPRPRISPGSWPATRARPASAPRSATCRRWVSTRKALEEALGMRFAGEKGEHFFRSTLVQTLFYGLFAAWVFWAEHHAPGDVAARFDWRDGRRLPAHPHPAEALLRLQPTRRSSALMRIDEVLDWAAEALNRVDRAAFFAELRADHAVQYFYEPFLEAFDPELRKELGVWYTPPEIVAVHGRARRHGAARGAGHRRRPGRPARRRARPLLRHRRLPGRGAGQDRRAPWREKRRRRRPGRPTRSSRRP